MKDKTSISWKKEKYLQICRILDEFNRQGNFCQIKKTKDGFKCKNKCSKELCCSSCSHLSETGCLVQSIMCKASYCFVGSGPQDQGLVITNEQKRIASRRIKFMLLLNEFIKLHNIPCYPVRASMEDQFKLQEMFEKDKSLRLGTVYNFFKAQFVK